jgi:hypothetical protein
MNRKTGREELLPSERIIASRRELVAGVPLPPVHKERG